MSIYVLCSSRKTDMNPCIKGTNINLMGRQSGMPTIPLLDLIKF